MSAFGLFFFGEINKYGKGLEKNELMSLVGFS